MKIAFLIAVIASAFCGAPARADWTCTMTCGSRGQEPKVGHGRDQNEARRDAQQQTCTQYVGGHPQFDAGCSYENNDGGHWNNPYPPHHGNPGNPYPGNPYQQWECTYTCGSKSFQEPKVGYGRSPDEARWNAQNQNCTQYVGGRPQFFQGCRRVQ